jgi:putative SOS response-associated peptidase YedK
MCTLYSITTNQEAIGWLFRVTRDSTGNLPSMLAAFPDWQAPVVRNAEGGRELAKMPWGLPNPPQHGAINTNIRNPRSAHRRRCTNPPNPEYDPEIITRNRCLVPANSFSECNDKPNPASLKNPDGTKHAIGGTRDVVWFALDQSRPLFAFAGI